MTEENETINFFLNKYSDGSVCLGYFLPFTMFQTPVLVWSDWEQYRAFAKMVAEFLKANDTPIASAFLKAFKEEDNASQKQSTEENDGHSGTPS